MRKPKKYIKTFTPYIQGQPIKSVKWCDKYKYLGVSVGQESPASLEKLGSEIIKKSGHAHLKPTHRLGKILTINQLA